METTGRGVPKGQTKENIWKLPNSIADSILRFSLYLFFHFLEGKVSTLPFKMSSSVIFRVYPCSLVPFVAEPQRAKCREGMGIYLQEYP